MECLPHAKESEHTQGARQANPPLVMGFNTGGLSGNNIYESNFKIDDYFA